MPQMANLQAQAEACVTQVRLAELDTLRDFGHSRRAFRYRVLQFDAGRELVFFSSSEPELP